METILQRQKQTQISEVYITDISILRNIFITISNSEKATEAFGIPFLLLKKKNDILAFASLIINQMGKTDFIIYVKSALNTEEKEDFTSHVEKYFRKNNSANYRNPTQLKYSIDRIINWLNV